MTAADPARRNVPRRSRRARAQVTSARGPWHDRGMATAERHEPRNPRWNTAGPIVLYDGTCGLCHKTVRLVAESRARSRAAVRARCRARPPRPLRVVSSKDPGNVLVDGPCLSTADRALSAEQGIHARGEAHGARGPWRWAYAFSLDGPARFSTCFYRFHRGDPLSRCGGRCGTCATCRHPSNGARFLV